MKSVFPTNIEYTVSLAITGLIVLWIFHPVLKSKYLKNCFVNCDEIVNSDGSIKIRSSERINEREIKYKLSIVIPAYNEESRISSMLESTIAFLSTWTVKRVEILIVDDGSKDHTIDVIEKYMIQSPEMNIRILQLPYNMGKGAAVRQGMLTASGEYILMADADGATDIHALNDLYTALQPSLKSTSSSYSTPDIAIGSRAHLDHQSTKSRAWYRSILMYGFHILVQIFCTKKIKDTQCGFKLFTYTSANRIFTNLHLERWAFDIEIIYLAELLGYRIVEIPVKWQEIDGSKLIQSKYDIILTSLTMARDMICVRLCYLLGIWKVNTIKYN